MSGRPVSVAKAGSFPGEGREIGARIHTAELWGNRYKFVREAMTLAEFTKLSPVDSVRLGEDPPDGWIGTPALLKLIGTLLDD